MIRDPITPYATVEDLALLTGVDPSEEGMTSLLEASLLAGAELIVNYCGRDFHLHTEERTFDVPVGWNLMVDDLLEITTLAVYGVTLTTYLLLPGGEFSHSRIIRMDSGSPQVALSWDTDRSGRARWGGISITGTWGYEATYDPDSEEWTEVIPERVARANLILSTRLWVWRDTLYTGAGGGGQLGRKPVPSGVWTDEVSTLLDSLVRQPVPVVIGA